MRLKSEVGHFRWDAGVQEDIGTGERVLREAENCATPAPSSTRTPHSYPQMRGLLVLVIVLVGVYHTFCESGKMAR